MIKPMYKYFITCQSIQEPVFLTAATDANLLLDDCKLGQILDVYNISDAVTNEDPCVAFKCGVEPDYLFWVENGKFVFKK